MSKNPDTKGTSPRLTLEAREQCAAFIRFYRDAAQRGMEAAKKQHFLDPDSGALGQWEHWLSIRRACEWLYYRLYPGGGRPKGSKNKVKHG